MTERRESQPEPDDLLDELVAGCLDSDPGSLAAAVESACARHPEHADELRRRIAALRRVGLVERTPAGATGDFPERLGDFRLRERLGGGGMGVVYRAEQVSLGREVALKLIRPEHLYFPKARERFQRETEAVARLQHPGIVPIYTVGEDNGVPFFSMELVSGCTLAEVVKELQGRAPESLQGADLRDALRRAARAQGEPRGLEGSWVECCVRLVIQVAEALEHAHSRGVLHRDVKPSNIALSLDGRAMLLDFGLATLGDDGARVTASGSTIGTLLYMSPEQIRGDAARVDQRSDVYSLGVTLYELLTLQAPFFDSNAIGTRQAILDGRADGIRVRNRAVPRDLELVCLKAMELDSARRYASAADFALDLRNLLELRPIQARPPSPLLRARRWVQRNPATSTALALGFVLLVGVPSALYQLQRNHAKELELALAYARVARQSAELAEADARAQRDRAQLEARDAEAVSVFMVDLFGAADPANARGEDLTAVELLRTGELRLRDELAEQPEVRRRLLVRIGSSYSSLGEYERAASVLDEAVALARELHGEDSPEIAEAYHRRGWLMRTRGNAKASEDMERALAIARATWQGPHDVTVRYLIGMAAVHSGARRNDEALSCFAEAEQLLDQLSGDQRKLRELLLANQAFTLNAARRYEEAAEVAGRAADLQRELYGDSHPGLLASLNTRALALKSLGRLEEAAPVFEELVRSGERVHGRESAPFAIFLMNHAGFLDGYGRGAEALARYEEAWEIFARTAGPDFPQAVTCRANMAGLLLRSQRYAEALALYTEVVPRLEAADGMASSRALGALFNCGLCAEALGLFEEALVQLGRAEETGVRMSEPSAALRLARVRSVRARVALRLGLTESADADLRSSAEFVRDNPTRTLVTTPWKFASALVQLARGERAAAEALLDELSSAQPQEDELRWISSAAASRMASLRGDSALAESALSELDAALGRAHPESRAALEVALELARAQGALERAAALEAERARRR